MKDVSVQSPDFISHREFRLGQTIAFRLPGILARRKLAPLFSEFCLTHIQGMCILFAVLDTSRINFLERYTDPGLLHQISTELGGRPVYVSNTTGLRYAVLLSPPPSLPDRIELPHVIAGRVGIGQRFNGQTISELWSRLGHLLVAGMTGSGKSVFLRSLVYQGLANEMRLMLADVDQATFPMLTEHPSLLTPIATTPAEALQLIEQALVLCDTRAALFKSMVGFPDHLEEYNMSAIQHGLAPLPRVLVVLDEFSATASAMGGGRGVLGQRIAELGWRARKFGVTLVFAAQEFTKEVTGPLRDQVSTAICFRVRSGEMADRISCPGANHIPSHRAGLAITNRWGPIQVFYVDKSRLVAGRSSPDISPRLLALLQRSLAETQGRLSIPLLVGWGMREREARSLLDHWEAGGWVRRDATQGNARIITVGFAEMVRQEVAGVSNRQTGQSLSI